MVKEKKSCDTSSGIVILVVLEHHIHKILSSLVIHATGRIGQKDPYRQHKLVILRLSLDVILTLGPMGLGFSLVLLEICVSRN